jgi:hypothetical protein
MAIIFHGAVILHEKHFSSDGQGFTHYKSSEAFFSQGHTLPFMDIPSLFAAFQMLHWRPAPFVAHTFQYLCEAKLSRITKAYAVCSGWRMPPFERVFRLAALCLILPCLTRPGSYFVLAA